MTERRKLVSILTPTWQRHDLLLRAVENVRAQTYRPLEHVVVSDGPDDDLQYRLIEPDNSFPRARRVGVNIVQLGRNWSSYLPDSFCAAPLMVAMLLATGDYQTWLADDETMEPDHVASLVDALEADDADFAYSRVELYRANDPGRRWTIGTDPPERGQITNVLYRADLLKSGLYPFNAGMTSDWACVERWLRAGARYAFVDRLTLMHRVDH
jgi:GT2 family glycosyltransferase